MIRKRPGNVRNLKVWILALFFAEKLCLTPPDDEDRAENVMEVKVKTPLPKDLGGGMRSRVGRGLRQKLMKFDTNVVQAVLKLFLIDQEYHF